MKLIDTLIKLGFSENEIKVYISLLQKGTASVRTLSQITNIGRGTVYNILNDLKQKGLVGFSEKGKLKYFSIKDPENVLHEFEEKIKEVSSAKKDFENILPELREMYGEGGKKPKVTYYTGRSGIKSVLEDILFEAKKQRDKLVYLYSSEELRSIVYESYSEFTKKRIDFGIKIKVIKIGKGGFLRGLDEAKVMSSDFQTRTYTYIYANKLAYISYKSSGYIMCTIIDEENISNTQRFLFESLYNYLPNLNLPLKKRDF